MEQVTGIGGVFFKARNPQRMEAWYRDNLGLRIEDGHIDSVWPEHERTNEVGRTVWSLFAADSDYLGSGNFMINYRVSNLDRMIEQLKKAGIAVEKVEEYDYGRFTWITDPEGNRIELWEPKP